MFDEMSGHDVRILGLFGRVPAGERFHAYPLVSSISTQLAGNLILSQLAHYPFVLTRCSQSEGKDLPHNNTKKTFLT
jgi:hypothetical protein